MMAKMTRATPEQLARMNELCDEWRAQAANPMVAAGAAMSVIMNCLAHDVDPEYREEVIEVFYEQMRDAFVDG